MIVEIRKSLFPLLVAFAVVAFGSYSVGAASPLITTVTTVLIEHTPQVAPPVTLKEGNFGYTGGWLALNIPGVQMVRGQGYSMSPMIADGGLFATVPIIRTDEIKVGTVITYQSDLSGLLVAHQVIELGEDNQGWYAWTKGTGNFNRDLVKVRFASVKGRLVAIFY